MSLALPTVWLSLTVCSPFCLDLCLLLTLSVIGCCCSCCSCCTCQKIAKGKRDIALAAERRAQTGVHRAHMSRLKLGSGGAGSGTATARIPESKDSADDDDERSSSGEEKDDGDDDDGVVGAEEREARSRVGQARVAQIKAHSEEEQSAIRIQKIARGRRARYGDRGPVGGGGGGVWSYGARTTREEGRE